MIHVCYGLFDKDGKYSKWAGTSILSMFENSFAPPKSLTVHILHDNTLTKSNYEKFAYIAGLYRQNIEFHNVEILCPDKIQYLLHKVEKYVNFRFSIGAFYRLFVSKKFFQPNDVSKIIYLDSDTIINLDISELWNTPIKDFPIAAVPEIKSARDYMVKNKYLLKSGQVKQENYFCSGIIILNLEKLGEKFFYDMTNWLSDNLECECPDQDALNYFFSENYYRLPEKFNSFVDMDKITNGDEVFRKIYHYAGQAALGFDMQNSHDKLFFSYFTKTPWFNENTISNMFESAKKYYAEAKELAVIYSAISAGKKRVFFTSSTILDVVKHIFAIKNTEKIIIEEAANSISELITLMKTSHDENFFFIMSDRFAGIASELKNAGFTEGEDFIDATLFLSDKNGIATPPWIFLKEM